MTFWLAGDVLLEAGKKPEPFSKSKTSNWVAKAGGLPTFIQHVAHDIIESGSIKDTSHAIAAAISQAKKWAAKGNKEAAAAIAQWSKMKAQEGLTDLEIVEGWAEAYEEVAEAANAAKPGDLDYGAPGPLSQAQKDARTARRRKAAAAKRKKDSGTGTADPAHPRGTGALGGQFIAKAGGGDTSAEQAAAARALGNLNQMGAAATIRAFQRKHGLQVDGVIGRQTALALAGRYGEAKSAAPGAMGGHASRALLAAHQARGGPGTPRRRRKAGEGSPRARGGFLVEAEAEAFWLAEVEASDRLEERVQIDWDPREHPRDAHGQFTEKIGRLMTRKPAGSSIRLPDGTTVRKDADGTVRVVRSGRIASGFQSPAAAARDALDRSARGTQPESVGGATRHDSFNAFLSSQGLVRGEAVTQPEVLRRQIETLQRDRAQATSPEASEYERRRLASLDAALTQKRNQLGRLERGDLSPRSPDPRTPSEARADRVGSGLVSGRGTGEGENVRDMSDDQLRQVKARHRTGTARAAAHNELIRRSREAGARPAVVRAGDVIPARAVRAGDVIEHPQAERGAMVTAVRHRSDGHVEFDFDNQVPSGWSAPVRIVRPTPRVRVPERIEVQSGTQPATDPRTGTDPHAPGPDAPKSWRAWGTRPDGGHMSVYFNRDSNAWTLGYSGPGGGGRGPYTTHPSAAAAYRAMLPSVSRATIGSLDQRGGAPRASAPEPELSFAETSGLARTNATPGNSSDDWATRLARLGRGGRLNFHSAVAGQDGQVVRSGDDEFQIHMGTGSPGSPVGRAMVSQSLAAIGATFGEPRGGRSAQAGTGVRPGERASVTPGAARTDEHRVAFSFGGRDIVLHLRPSGDGFVSRDPVAAFGTRTGANEYPRVARFEPVGPEESRLRRGTPQVEINGQRYRLRQQDVARNRPAYFRRFTSEASSGMTQVPEGATAADRRRLLTRNFSDDPARPDGAEGAARAQAGTPGAPAATSAPAPAAATAAQGDVRANWPPAARGLVDRAFSPANAAAFTAATNTEIDRMDVRGNFLYVRGRDGRTWSVDQRIFSGSRPIGTETVQVRTQGGDPYTAPSMERYLAAQLGRGSHTPSSASSNPLRPSLAHAALASSSPAAPGASRSGPSPAIPSPGEATAAGTAPTVRGSAAKAAKVQGIVNALHGFSHNGYTCKMTGGSESGFNGVVLNADGRQVGSFSREVHWRGDQPSWIYHSIFTIREGERDSGFGSGLIQKMFDSYREQGFKYVKVTAGLDAGGYQWAKMGFDFADGNSASAARGVVVYKVESVGQAAVDAGRIPQAMLDEFKNQLAEGWITSPAQIAAWGRSTTWTERRAGQDHKMWLGKALLLGSGWSGKYDLQRDRSRDPGPRGA